EIHALRAALIALLARVDEGELDPVVALKGDEKIDVSPFPLRAHEGLTLQRFPTFQQALDAFFGRAVTTEKVDPRLKKLGEEKAKVQRMLDAQHAALAKFDKEEVDSKRKGDLIYAHFELAGRVARTLWDAGKSLGWKEVQEKLKAGKAAGHPEALVVDALQPH